MHILLRHLRLRSRPPVLPPWRPGEDARLPRPQNALRPDGTVMLLLLNSVEFVLMFLTCSSLDAAATTANPLHTPTEITRGLRRHCGRYRAGVLQQGAAVQGSPASPLSPGICTAPSSDQRGSSRRRARLPGTRRLRTSSVL